ncbi:Putative carotenoid oxygenase [Septoria linicola]|uniref:Carotenoid oxygenase n=1 Tax=Septoria linicola TaxID=215465 RepID=A0A9Q9AT21_9PEZI|nr:putative carotenoid oxygenase [Septoria linicola]USW50231.1 Putative carotenoid oxygenase [Septoria linicola]
MSAHSRHLDFMSKGHTNGNLANGTINAAQSFPDRPQFSDFMKPCRFEGEIQNIEVIGSIPDQIDGTFYRVMPDPQFPPFIEDDPWFNGDGNISAVKTRSGKVDFRQRFVRTEKFVREREAGRALLGKYRNKYTDAVEFTEDSPPYTLDPLTLETRGLEDFNGHLPACTFTAHPKIDPVTGEMVAMGYEAKGDGTPDVCYYTFDAKRKILETAWMICPIIGIIHDFAVTRNWILCPVIPQTCDLERMEAGGEHWQWSPDVPFYIGVLTRRNASGDDVKWFRAPKSFPGHVANAFEDSDGYIVLDLPICDKNAFFWWPDKDGRAPAPHEVQSSMRRFVIDPTSTELDIQSKEILLETDCEFPRIDDRYAMREYRHLFCAIMDASLPSDIPAIMSKRGGGSPFYNAIGHLDIRTRMLRSYFPGPTHTPQEAVFVQRSEEAEEADGWIMFLVNNYS